jgi:ATP-dependent exoDNAse (exonuclease V) beta subunit
MLSRKPLKPKNRAVVAAAGSGKTSLIAAEAARDMASRSLVLTFTKQNQELLSQKIAMVNNGLPPKM